MALSALLRLLLLPTPTPPLLLVVGTVEKIEPDEVAVEFGDETEAEELDVGFFKADMLISGLIRSCCSICGAIRDRAEGICCER